MKEMIYTSKLLNIIGKDCPVSCTIIRKYEMNEYVSMLLQIQTLPENTGNKPKFFTFDVRMDKKMFSNTSPEDLKNVTLLSKAVNIADGISAPVLCVLEPCDRKFIMSSYRNMITDKKMRL